MVSTEEKKAECPTTTTTSILNDLSKKYPHQPTFLQSVEEMALSLEPLFNDPVDGDFYRRAFAVMTEPERIISFRVPWMDDEGVLRMNRGWRVEFSSVLGPYKGGLRFHPTVTEDILKFLGFEQIFKNALTGLPMGGGKGGSDFDPKGKSDGEVRRFCQSFMAELGRYLHPSRDVPAGDIGVGGREIGYLYGEYKRMTNKHGEGVLTGKSLLHGGSHIRPEATGYGTVYIADLALQKECGLSLENSRCAISGSGNVAQYAAEKLLDLGAKVLTVSDSNGVLVFEDGMTREDLRLIMEAKNIKRARLATLSSLPNATYVPHQTPWSLPNLPTDYAFPSATQNEISAADVERLITRGLRGVFEGANLPTTLDGQRVIRKHPFIVYIPAKAANAGGVGVSGLEMSQNAQRLTWTREEVDGRLKDMMGGIYEQMREVRDREGGVRGATLEMGANQAGFIKLAKAMRELGWFY